MTAPWQQKSSLFCPHPSKKCVTHPQTNVPFVELWDPARYARGPGGVLPTRAWGDRASPACAPCGDLAPRLHGCSPGAPGKQSQKTTTDEGTAEEVQVPRENEHTDWKRHRHPMLTAALSTTAKTKKQPACPPADGG